MSAVTDVLLGTSAMACDGDLGHKRMKEPDDLAVSVSMSNVAAESSGRCVDFVYMACALTHQIAPTDP